MGRPDLATLTYKALPADYGRMDLTATVIKNRSSTCSRHTSEFNVGVGDRRW